MNRPPMTNTTVVTTDYDSDQLRRELNSLRRNVHELCMRTLTGFDCNRFLDNVDKIPAITVKTTAKDRHSNLICDKV